MIQNPGSDTNHAQLILQINRVLHSHFRGVSSNHEATSNVFNNFSIPR